MRFDFKWSSLVFVILFGNFLLLLLLLFISISKMLYVKVQTLTIFLGCSVNVIINRESYTIFVVTSFFIMLGQFGGTLLGEGMFSENNDLNFLCEN